MPRGRQGIERDSGAVVQAQVSSQEQALAQAEAMAPVAAVPLMWAVVVLHGMAVASATSAPQLQALSHRATMALPQCCIAR